MELRLLSLLHISLLNLFSFTATSHSVQASSSSSSPSLAKRDCPTHCGNIEIPYPFGMGPLCYHNDYRDNGAFQVYCNASTHPPKPFLNLLDFKIGPEILTISLSGTLRIKSPIVFSDCPNKPNNTLQLLPNIPNLPTIPLSVSDKNQFTSVSCGRIASLTSPKASGGAIIAVCLSICDHDRPLQLLSKDTCNGINCCQTSIRTLHEGVFNAVFGDLISGGSGGSASSCKYAFLVDQEWFTSNSTNTSAIVDMDFVPLVLNWWLYEGVGGLSDRNSTCDSQTGYCSCAKGYEGNPLFSWWWMSRSAFQVQYTT